MRKPVGDQVAERALFDRVCDFSVDLNYVGSTSSFLLTVVCTAALSPLYDRKSDTKFTIIGGPFNDLLVRYGQALKDARDRLSDSAIHSGKCCSVAVLQQGIEGHYLLLGARRSISTCSKAHHALESCRYA